MVETTWLFVELVGCEADERRMAHNFEGGRNR